MGNFSTLYLVQLSGVLDTRDANRHDAITQVALLITPYPPNPARSTKELHARELV